MKEFKKCVREKVQGFRSKLNRGYIKEKLLEERGDIAWDKMGKAIITIVVVGVIIAGVVALFNTIIFPALGEWFKNTIK